MVEAPLIFYASEDDRTLDLLRKHLLTLGVIPDRIVLRVGFIEAQLKQIREERLVIILVSVDSLIFFQEQAEKLAQMIEQRHKRTGLTGIISVLCRPCAWRETVLAETRICSGSHEAPIAGGRRDQVCLNVAKDIRNYMQRWDKALKLAHVAPELKDMYGPAGEGEHFIGDQLTFAVGDSVRTGKVIYIQANGQYVVQVEEEHCIVLPCDVIERR